jgi:hypothetical protein
LWKLAAREDEAPRATDVRRGNREVLVAAALQGAIFALVQAALDRGLAEATRKLTGSWPGEGVEQAISGGSCPGAVARACWIAWRRMQPVKRQAPYLRQAGQPGLLTAANREV